jgi:hypothetical protein
MSVLVVAPPRIEPANLSRTESGESAWCFIKFTKGGLKQFAQGMNMERPLVAQSGRPRRPSRLLQELRSQHQALDLVGAAFISSASSVRWMFLITDIKVRDSNGAQLAEGDTVTLKLKGSSTVLKRGTVMLSLVRSSWRPLALGMVRMVHHVFAEIAVGARVGVAALNVAILQLMLTASYVGLRNEHCAHGSGLLLCFCATKGAVFACQKIEESTPRGAGPGAMEILRE